MSSITKALPTLSNSRSVGWDTVDSNTVVQVRTTYDTTDSARVMIQRIDFNGALAPTYGDMYFVAHSDQDHCMVSVNTLDADNYIVGVSNHETDSADVVSAVTLYWVEYTPGTGEFQTKSHVTIDSVETNGQKWAVQPDMAHDQLSFLYAHSTPGYSSAHYNRIGHNIYDLDMVNKVISYKSTLHSYTDSTYSMDGGASYVNDFSFQYFDMADGERLVIQNASSGQQYHTGSTQYQKGLRYNATRSGKSNLGMSTEQVGYTGYKLAKISETMFMGVNVYDDTYSIIDYDNSNGSWNILHKGKFDMPVGRIEEIQFIDAEHFIIVSSATAEFYQTFDYTQNRTPTKRAYYITTGRLIDGSTGLIESTNWKKQVSSSTMARFQSAPANKTIHKINDTTFAIFAYFNTKPGIEIITIS